MAQRKINKDYLNDYSEVILIQPLKSGDIRQTYTKGKGGWKLTHSTTSPFHICPYDGIFRDCKVCGALEDDFDINYCLDKIRVLSSGAVVNRINDCIGAGLEVKFID